MYNDISSAIPSSQRDNWDSITNYLYNACQQSGSVCTELDSMIVTSAKGDDIAPGCKKVFSDCNATICSKGSTDSTLQLSCDQVKDFFVFVTKIPALADKMKQYGIDPMNICGSLADLAQGQTISTFLQAILDKALGNNHYDTVVPVVVSCLCPPPSSPPASPPTYSWRSIVVMLSVILLSFGASLVVMKNVGKMSWGGILGVLLVVVGLTGGAVIYFNPGCLFRTCTADSDILTPQSNLAGTYTGTKTLLGVSVNAAITIDKNNLITIQTLKCNPSGVCPIEDLLSKCAADKNVNITYTKDDLGYPLYGACIDNLRTIMSTDNQPILNGIWITSQKGILTLYLKLHICVDNICIPHILDIQLSNGS
jgi:hypothetical protein